MSQTKAQLIDPVDGTIVNADINASAAIAGSKISPDFGSQNIATTGTLACGDITSSDGNGNLTLKDNNHTGNNTEHKINFTASDNTDLINFISPFGEQHLRLRHGSTELVKFQIDGKVGIGTTGPNELLEVAGNCRLSSGGATRTLHMGPASAGIEYNVNGTTFIQGRTDAYPLAFKTQSAERMRIDASGNVGIGTTSPTSKIDIHCGSDNTGLQITSTDAGAFASYFDNTGASTIGHQGTALTLSCDPAGSVGSSAIVFQIDSNSEKMRIDTGGRLLIGITTARANFGNNTSGVEQQIQLEGTTATKSTMSLIRNSNDANDGGIILGKTRGTSVGSNTVVQAGDDLGALNFVGADGTSLQFAAAISATVESGVGNDDMPASLKFFTNGGSTSMSERVRITSGGFLYVNKTSSSDFGRFEVKGGTADDIETSDIRTETVATFSGSSPGTTASGKGVGIVIKPIADRGCNFFIGTANSSSNQEAHGSLIFRSGNFASATAERLRIDQNGHLLPGADNSLNLGSASKRWANLYTTDLKLSNEGSQNDVDSTWGNYTIQEGYEDLFLINHRTGKKFKFNLTEVA